MKDILITEGYVPLDKSWTIRHGVLDLIHDLSTTNDYLKTVFNEVSEDLQALFTATTQWPNQQEITVGESGTLLRYLQFLSWHEGSEKTFRKSKTLANRNICDDPNIVNWPLEQLLTLDNGTSQYASIAVLLGNTETVETVPYKLQVTYDALENWTKTHAQGEAFSPKYDETILNQAVAYLNWRKTGEMEFVPEQAEDYCFARRFGKITPVEGEARWPALRGHESDRIEEMEQTMKESVVTTRDHRPAQAEWMYRNDKNQIQFPEATYKTWREFPRFMEDVPNLITRL